jgi:hypothetical protein
LTGKTVAKECKRAIMKKLGGEWNVKNEYIF